MSDLQEKRRRADSNRCLCRQLDVPVRTLGLLYAIQGVHGGPIKIGWTPGGFRTAGAGTLGRFRTMRRRLPPKGTPARQAHEHLLRANRQLAKALGLLAQVDLDADSREMIREETRGVADALTLLRHKLKRPRQ